MNRQNFTGAQMVGPKFPWTVIALIVSTYIRTYLFLRSIKFQVLLPSISVFSIKI